MCIDKEILYVNGHFNWFDKYKPKTIIDGNGHEQVFLGVWKEQVPL
jgi:hypothetical protein